MISVDIELSNFGTQNAKGDTDVTDNVVDHIPAPDVAPLPMKYRVLLQVAKVSLELVPLIIIVAHASDPGHDYLEQSLGSCWVVINTNLVAVSLLASMSLSSGLELFMLLTSIRQCSYCYQKGVFIACCTVAILLQLACCIAWPYLARDLCFSMPIDLGAYLSIFLMKVFVAMVNVGHLSYLFPIYYGRRCRFCVGCMRYGLKTEYP
jgi:hypothetical protein